MLVFFGFLSVFFVLVYFCLFLFFSISGEWLVRVDTEVTEWCLFFGILTGEWRGMEEGRSLLGSWPES